MKLIVGLGNPGRQYALTPHNVGFEIVDILASRHGGAWTLERRLEAETAEITLQGVRTTLMKPLTYMNLSGRSVAEFARRNGTEPGEILAISDDINLPLGQLRMRPNGSHGGHKGLLSIINCISSLDFPRLRVGVRPADENLANVVDFVLSRLRPADREELELTKQDAADAVEMIFKKDLVTAMNQFNKRKPPE
ncbi:MAG: aminoacyl-tRNA hydrolase [Candidatus Sumerlaeaceae bacterium]|nr:aminoacyl-tRNA hydrolase [Candidatus Sumerlaeaceae bacterium]